MSKQEPFIVVGVLGTKKRRFFMTIDAANRSLSSMEWAQKRSAEKCLVFECISLPREPLAAIAVNADELNPAMKELEAVLSDARSYREQAAAPKSTAADCVAAERLGESLLSMALAVSKVKTMGASK